MPLLIKRIPLLGRPLAKAALGSLALNVTSRLLSLVTSIALARWLGASGFGIYSAALAILLLLRVPAQLGMPILVVRMLASYRAHQEWGLMRGLLQRATTISLLVSLLLSVAGAWILHHLGDQLSPAYTDSLLWVLALAPVAALVSLFSASVQGLHHVVLGQLPENLALPASFIGLVGLLVVLHTGASLSPELVLGFRFAATLLALCIGAWILIKHLPRQVLTADTHFEMRKWALAAAPLILLGGMTIINNQVDVLMLATLRNAGSAGVYRVAARGAEFVAFSLVVVQMVIQPRVAHLYSSGELKHLQRLLTVSARVTGGLALPVALSLICFGKPILHLVYGVQYERGALAMSILCIAQLANVAAGSVGLILNMTGHERDSAMGLAVAAVVNIGLNAVLIPLWGVDGAAVATGLSLILWNAMLAMRVWRRTGIDPSALGIRRVMSG